MTFIGANIGGLADGSGNIANTDYNIPDPQVILDAFLTAGRIPFTSARVCTAPGYISTVTSVAAPLVAAKAAVVLDPHDFGNVWDPAASAPVSIATAHGAALHSSLMASMVGAVKAAGLDEDYVCIGLMNEPGLALDDVGFMETCWQPAVNTLRGAGFKGWIEIPIAGSQEAYKVTPATPYPARVSDPLNRCLLGGHSYGDLSNKGLGDASGSATEIADRFSGLIAWFRESGTQQGFAGIVASEFGTASTDPVSQADFARAMALFVASPDAVWAATAWTMDPWMRGNGNWLGTEAAPTANLTTLEEAATPAETSLVVYLAGDSYAGPPVANILLDGEVVVSNVTVTATRMGAPQAVPVPAMLTPGAHTVGVQFQSDDYGGSPAEDRNLYVLAITVGGKLCCGCPGDFAALPSAGTHEATITVPQIATSTSTAAASLRAAA